MTTIDSHHHLWQLTQPFNYRWLDGPLLAPIKRDFLPLDLAPLLKATGIEKSVVVQTQHDLAENRWALGLAEQNEFIAGVVGWVDLASPDCERQLLEFKDQPKFVGVRHVTQDEPDENFIVREDVLRGLAVLEKHAVPFDLLFYARHLRHAPAVAGRLPNLKLVLDHCSKPRIKQGEIDEWKRELAAAAKFPNLYCKISGLITEADWEIWRIADLKPYVEHAIECFGPHRCMFGSDWPVCLLAGSYERWKEAADDLFSQYSAAERGMMKGETAVEFYGLKV